MAVITASPKNFVRLIELQETANENLFTMRKLLENAQLTQIATLVETKKIDQDGERQEKIEADTLDIDKQLLITQKEMLASMKEQAKIRSEEAQALANMAEGMKTFRSIGERISDLKKGFTDKFSMSGIMKSLNVGGVLNKSIAREDFIKQQKAIDPTKSRAELKESFKGAQAASKDIKKNEAQLAEFKKTTGLSDADIAKTSKGKELLAKRETLTSEYSKFDLRSQFVKQESETSLASPEAKTPTSAFASAGEQQEMVNEQLKVQGAQSDLLAKIEENTRPGGTPTTKAADGGGGGGLLGGIGLGMKALGVGIQGLMSGAGKGIAAFLRGLAIGLAAIANPATLIGLGALTLSIMGIGKALEMAAPFMEAFAPVLMKVVETIQTVFVAAIEKIPEVIKAVGDVIMGVIGAISNSIVAIIDAVTASIERLAALDGSSLLSVGAGLAAVAAGMIAFAGANAVAGVGNLVSGFLGAITPGGSPVDQIMKLGNNGANIEKAGAGIEKLGNGLKMFSAIDTDKIKAIAALPTEKIAAMGAAMGNAATVESRSAQNRALNAQASSAGAGGTSVVAPTINNTTRQTQLIKPPTRNQESSIGSWLRSKYA